MRVGWKPPRPVEEGRGMAVLEELLAMLLPEEDLQKALKQLRLRLGCLENMMLAPEAELAQLPGMTARSARFLRLTWELARAYMEDTAAGVRDVMDFSCYAERMRPVFLGVRTERVAVLLLDSGGRYLYCEPVFEGSISGVALNFRRLVGLCDSYDASGLVVAHNHPTGDVFPSTEDIVATGQILRALLGVGIDLKDHIIFTERDMFSFLDSSLLPTMRTQALEEQWQRMEGIKLIATDFLQEHQ